MLRVCRCAVLLVGLLACATPSEAPRWNALPWEEVLEVNDAGDGSARAEGVPLAAPPLRVDELVAGRPWTIRLDGLTPGTVAHVGLSSRGRGSGPCLPVALGGCLGIREPVLHLGSAVADAAGRLSLTVAAPEQLGPVYVVQALLAPPDGESWYTTAVVEVTGR